MNVKALPYDCKETYEIRPSSALNSWIMTSPHTTHATAVQQLSEAQQSQHGAASNIAAHRACNIQRALSKHRLTTDN